MNKTQKLTLSAVMVAAATVLTLLSGIIPFRWLQGGSVTLASAVPILLIGLLCGTKWGLLGGVVFALIQMMQGFYAPPTPTWYYFFLVIFLDYIAAFGVYGLAGSFYRLLGKKSWAIPTAGAICLILRFVCHFFSGLLIWGVYAEAGQSVWAYSLIYNGGYMLPEAIINTAVLAVLIPFILKIKEK